MGSNHKRRLSRLMTYGFTLVELIVVILVIVVLAGVLTPVLLKGREWAEDVKCRNNLRQIGMALTQYAIDEKYLPYGGGVGPGNMSPFECLYRSMQDPNPALFVCPVDPLDGQEFDWQNLSHSSLSVCSYTWSEEAVSFQLKTANIRESETLGLICDGMVASNGNNWKNVKPLLSSKDREAASQWVHRSHYVNFLYGNLQRVDNVHIDKLESVRSDPRFVPGQPEEKER